MKSPFPGMDPYLEQYWRNVHLNLIAAAQGQLNERLPGDLRARVEERIVLELPTEEHAYVPDMRVAEHGATRQGQETSMLADVMVAEPLKVALREPETQGFIEILATRPERRVITVIEVLSPSNKYAGPGREQYRQRQLDLRNSSISLVEIDLPRAGHVLQLPFEQFPPLYRTPYKVCVHRGWTANAEIYRLPLREGLPAIRIPLRESDTDVPLDLQAMVDEVYRRSRYDDIDYTVPAVPPLQADDEKWADELLRAARKRP